MNEITLDELIGNLQTYELRRSSQVNKEAKRNRGLALKALESDDSDLDFEEIAMVTDKPIFIPYFSPYLTQSFLHFHALSCQRKVKSTSYAYISLI